MKRLLLWLGLLLLITDVVRAQEDTLRVNAAQSLGAISPYVYGTNYGFGASVVPLDLMPQAQALGLRYLRLGSNTSDARNLDRPTLDFFILQAKQIGVEPAATVRLLGGTPEGAADIVRYANIEKDYNIRYWSIGNEPNFYETVHHVPSYTTEDLNRDWRAIAEAMLAVDPNIVLIGPDISQYVVLNAEPDNIRYLEGPDSGGAPRDSLGRDWLQEFLRANGDLVDVVSIHRYPYPWVGGRANASATIEGLRANSREWDTSIPNLRRIIREAAERDIPIAVTEINSNSIPTLGGEAGPDTFYNAIWFADVLGRLIRQQVEIVLYWNLRSTMDGYGLLGLDDVRPTYYVYMMYQQFGTELLNAESADPDVSIYAARRDDGALTLIVVNLGPDERRMTLQLNGFTPGRDAEVWRFDADHNAERIGTESIENEGAVSVPGQSITLYIVPEQ